MYRTAIIVYATGFYDFKSDFTSRYSGLDNVPKAVAVFLGIV